MAQVYVGNLNSRVSDKNIGDEFRKYGATQYVRISRKSPNYAFVDFDDRNDALSAIRNLDGINGWHVNLSHNFKGGSGGGGRGGRRGGRSAAEELKCCYECGQPGHFAKACRFSGRGADQRVDDCRRIDRENIAYGNKVQSKVEVDEVPREKVNIISERKIICLFEEDGAMTEKPKAKLEEKEWELGGIVEENDNLRRMLNEANSKIREAKAQEEEITLKFKIQSEELNKSQNQVTFARTKAEDLSLTVKGLRAELETRLRKHRAELETSKRNAYSAKAREAEMNLKLKTVQSELEKVKKDASLLMTLEEALRESEKKVVQLQKKLNEVKGEKETLETEMKTIRGKADEWRKAADAAAAIFAVGVEINTEISESEPLVLCYNNRATSSISIGRVREALCYCRMAAALDPSFHEVHLTAANCHLLLGEIEDALYNYNKCLEMGNKVCLDRIFTIEAADGLQKAQKVVNCTNQSAELLQHRTFASAAEALGVLAKALVISCYSEKLLEMKADALFLMRKYEEVVQLCEQTHDFAKKNFVAVGVSDPMTKLDGFDSRNSLDLWRWDLLSRSYFHMGRLERALELTEKQEQLRSGEDMHESRSNESSSNLAVTLRKLLHCKNAGNEAFHSGRHTEAIEHYTNAISRSVESRPFAAVCICNRAAAHQALGKLIDAIADCSLAICLDGSYTKALSRRATLHEMIRDYSEAANDLRRLLSVLEKQSDKKSQQSEAQDRSSGCSVSDISRVQRRLLAIEAKAKKGTPLDLYLILGLKASDASSEVKKAYRNAALRHHPDKAGQFLMRSEHGDDERLWKDILKTIHVDADRLFKMIGKANDVLSDSTKRSKYDREEEMRTEDKHPSKDSC